MSSSDESSHLWIIILVIIAVSASVLVWYQTHLSRKKKRKLVRSWSFTSEGMRVGVFPPAVKAPPTMINTILHMQQCPTKDNLLKFVVQPLLDQDDRFRCIPTEGGLLPCPEDFDPTDLIREIVVQDEEELHKTLNDISLNELELPDGIDRQLPWWQVILVKTQGRFSVKASILLRIHHCLGDGLSLITAFDSSGVLKTKDGQDNESKVSNSLLKKPKGKSPSISSILEAVGHVVTLGASAFDTVPKLRNRETLTSSGTNQVSYFPSVPLSYIKTLKSVSETSVNDVLVCAISHAIAKVCLTDDSDEKKDKCRALMPVSLPRSNTSTMRNQFVMMSADMNVSSTSYKTILDRLQAVNKTTSFLKKSPRAFIQLWMQNNVVSKLPNSFGQQTAHDIFHRHSLVLTNVPGPEQICYFAKCPVDEVHLLFPNVIPQVDLLSYAGTIFGNIIYDPEQLTAGDEFTKAYAQALIDMGTELSTSAQDGISIPKELLQFVKK
mmetsp:Transcript_27670/g.41880  ORF Transcript_27670/g.41880 Transcript_27670/m.41880 type:complete len:495 (-) Transcript_27670:12-1496(-)